MTMKKYSEELGKAGELNTIVGKGTSIEGSMSVQHSLRVDGRINGNVSTTESIVVGKDGEIKGELSVGNAVIGGKVEGKIEANGKVVLESKSSFRGEMKTTKLVIDEGAFFDGNCVMDEKKYEKQATPIQHAPSSLSEIKNTTSSIED